MWTVYVRSKDGLKKFGVSRVSRKKSFKNSEFLIKRSKHYPNIKYKIPRIIYSLKNQYPHNTGLDFRPSLMIPCGYPLYQVS